MHRYVCVCVGGGGGRGRLEIGLCSDTGGRLEIGLRSGTGRRLEIGLHSQECPIRGSPLQRIPTSFT